MSAGLVGASSVDPLTADPLFVDNIQTDLDWLAATDQTTTLLTESSQRLEIIFVDENTPDYQLLIQDIEQNSSDHVSFEIVTIGSNEDGFNRITETLANHQNIDAVHICLLYTSPSPRDRG